MSKSYCSQCHDEAITIVKMARGVKDVAGLIDTTHDHLIKTCTHSVENPANKTKKGLLK